MMSNNGSTTYKNKRISFINKGAFILYMSILVMISLPCIVHWSEVPDVMKYMALGLWAIVLVAVLFVLLNGMIITENETVLFIPDFRFKKSSLKEIKRISLNFNEWKNNKYSVAIKFVYNDGKIFKKDYSKQFRNMKNKIIAMSVYTVAKKKVDKICNKLSNLDICVITILDKNGDITYQKKTKTMDDVPS